MNVLAQRTSPYSNSKNLTETPGMVIDQIAQPQTSQRNDRHCRFSIKADEFLPAHW